MAEYASPTTYLREDATTDKSGLREQFIPVPIKAVSREQKEEEDDIAADTPAPSTGVGTLLTWCLRVTHGSGVPTRTITLDTQDWRTRFFIVGLSAGDTATAAQWDRGNATMFEGAPVNWTTAPEVKVIGKEDRDPSVASILFTVTIGETGYLKLNTTSSEPDPPRPVTSVVTIQVVDYGPFDTAVVDV